MNISEYHPEHLFSFESGRAHHAYPGFVHVYGSYSRAKFEERIARYTFKLDSEKEMLDLNYPAI